LRTIIAARISIVLSALYLLSACSASNTAALPASTPGKELSSKTISRNASSTGGTATVVTNGCEFSSDGTIACAPNCVGYFDSQGTPVASCSGGAVGGPSDFRNLPNGQVTIGNPSGGGGGYAGNPVPPARNYNYAKRLWDAAMKFKASHSARHSTLRFGGASVGNECLAVINSSQGILQLAGLAQVANGTQWVPTFESALPNSGYVQVSQAATVAGDFVIQGDDKHIGICQTNGCTTMISNSSTPESFTWATTPDQFRSSYAGHPPNRFWHHT